jgi:signal transduction histidine kinase
MATPASPSQPNRSTELARLHLSQVPPDAPLDEVFRRACELSADALEVERVGVWLFIDDRTVLRCANLFERTTREHSSGTLLHVADFPTYFTSLKIFRAVPAEIAVTDAWTTELAASYLRPLGITSMLDVGLFVDDNLVGVVCHENVGPPREWTDEAREFASTIADVLASRIQAAEVNELRATFRTQGDRLTAMEKNAALERLAAGVVRDFKNLLAVFQGHGELISLNPDVPLAARQQATEIIAAADRGVALAGDLLQFARQDGQAAEVLDLGEAIAELLPALKAAVGARYELRYTQPGSLGQVLVDRTQFARLLTHLVQNASDAMPDGGPVEITLSAVKVTSASNSNPSVLLEVTDRGVGVDESTRLQVLEPYSAAKSTGSGLGLAIVRQVMDRAGGFIRIDSPPHGGTTFRMFFPRIGTSEGTPDSVSMDSAELT